MSLIPWLIWTLPVVGALLTPLLAKFSARLRDLAAVAFTLGAAVSATLSLLTVPAGDYKVPWISSLVSIPGARPIEAGILVDPLSMFMANIVAWISLLIMIYSMEYMKGDSGLTRYWFFMNLFIGNMLLLVLADNLLLMFFGWEGVGLCSYALIGHWYRDDQKYWVGTPGDSVLGVPQAYSPTHAGMKAFLITRIGDIGLLAGIFLIYSQAGTFNYSQLASQLGTSSNWAAGLFKFGLLVPAALLFFAGPIGKSAQFPLHEWLPDAMAGPTSVSALIHAATMVNAGVFLIGRMGPIFYQAMVTFGQVLPFFETVAWIGAFTAFLASTQASVAREIKKVLAYSTMSQIGYMMLGLGIAGLGFNFLAGYTAGLFHLMSQAVFKAAMFLAAGWVIHAAESRFMDEMGGLAKGMRLTYASMMLAGLSLMGIPPLSGFWTKDKILAISFETGQLALYGLGIATVVLTGFYTMRMLGMTFTGNPSHHMEELEREGRHVHEAKLTMLVPYLLLAVASLVLGVTFPFVSDTLAIFLEGSFNILPGTLPSEPFSESGFLSLLLFGVSVGAALSGGLAGYLLYFNKQPQAEENMKPLQRFLKSRWYLNAMYCKIFVNGTMAVSRGLHRFVELGIWDPLNYIVSNKVIGYSRRSEILDANVVDRAVNEVAAYGSRFSNLVRRLQTGITQQYVMIFALGIFLLLAYMFFVVGLS